MPAPARVSSPTTNLIEVGLGQFAAIGGLTEDEYARRMVSLIASGHLMDVLRPEAQADMYDWLEHHGLVESDREFVAMLVLSLNRARNVCLYATCRVDLYGYEPMLPASDVTSGLVGSPPRGGLPMFEIYFCDMEAILIDAASPKQPDEWRTGEES